MAGRVQVMFELRPRRAPTCAPERCERSRSAWQALSGSRRGADLRRIRIEPITTSTPGIRCMRRPAPRARRSPGSIAKSRARSAQRRYASGFVNSSSTPGGMDPEPSRLCQGRACALRQAHQVERQCASTSPRTPPASDQRRPASSSDFNSASRPAGVASWRGGSAPRSANWSSRSDPSTLPAAPGSLSTPASAFPWRNTAPCQMDFEARQSGFVRRRNIRQTTGIPLFEVTA